MEHTNPVQPSGRVAESIRLSATEIPVAGPPTRFRRYVRRSWPVVFILTLQSALSLHLVWSNTAFSDEALYLWAGHLEWAHWLHRMPIPAFQTYFSGAPVLYPPLAALADTVGGLSGARLLSLSFMLGATALLWLTTSRLYTKKAGFFACALWAFIGPTLHLSAFATYDAMSAFLIALSAWLVVQARPRRNTTGWLIISAIIMILANMTAYSTVIFDPTIVALAFLTGLSASRKLAGTRALELAIYAAALFTALITIGGPEYVKGLMQTVLARTPGTNMPSTVLHDAWIWCGAVVIAATVGVLISIFFKSQRQQLPLLTVFAATGLLVPLEQARIHTVVSLDKHSDIGAWFTAIAAGYAVDTISRLQSARYRQQVVTSLCAVTFIALAGMGFQQAKQLYDWPNSATFIDTLRPIIETVSGPVLVQSSSIPEYYLADSPPWWHWSSTASITLPNGHSLSPGVGRTPKVVSYARLINEGYFSLIALRHDPKIDKPIISQIWSNKYYHVVADPDYGSGHYTIWVYEPSVIGSAPSLPTRREPPGSGFIRSLLPIMHVNAFLAVVGYCFMWSACAAFLIVILVRCWWRAGKGLEDI
jgi:hypothetical protein